MKSWFIMLPALCLTLVTPATAQQPTPATPPAAPASEQTPDFNSVEVTIGAQQHGWNSDPSTQATTGSFVVAPDIDSAKFLEYRELPQGAVAPGFRFTGKKGTLWWDFSGRDVSQRDQSYFATLERGHARVSADYVGIPHNFGFGGRSILNPTTPNSWQVADTIQAAWQGALTATLPGRNIDYNCQARPGYTPRPGCLSLVDLVTPALDAQPPNVNLSLQRGRSNVALDLTPAGGPIDVNLTYRHEKRTGYRAVNGTAFGFGNVVETPEPVGYITQDLGLSAAYDTKWGALRAAVRVSDFSNRFDFFFFENPFRVTDSTDPNAYQAPGSQSINGAVAGQMSLPPDNQAFSETIGTTLRFGARTRLTADVTLGQWRQDDDPLAAWTTNTAISLPDGQPATVAPAFGPTLGGKIDTTAVNAFLHTTVLESLGLNARFRRYDLGNETPRHAMPAGYARFDAVWEEIPRITVPYGYTSDLFDVYATYPVGALGLEAGFRYNRMERTFRETEDTTEGVFRAAADYRAGWWSVRAIAELGSRDFDQYALEHSEDASFLEPGPPANQTVLRRPDQARRDLMRFGGQFEISPTDQLSLFAAYTRTEFEYDQDPVECQHVELFPGQDQFCPGGEQSPLGLIDDRYDSLSVEGTYRPSARLSLYGFYTYEDGDILQTGRQSGGTVNFNPADVWTANSTIKGNTFGAGAELTLRPDKLTAELFARYQKVDGFNDIYLQPGYSTSIYTSPLVTDCVNQGPSNCDVQGLDDTSLTYLYGTLRYQIATRWSAAFGLGWEDYEIDDDQSDSQLNYLPGSFFLQANNRGYDGWIGYVNLTYAFR